MDGFTPDVKASRSAATVWTVATWVEEEGAWTGAGEDWEDWASAEGVKTAVEAALIARERM
jgi:hypothetical protein